MRRIVIEATAMIIRQADAKRSKYLACQHKALEAIPARLKAELPDALGMSALATSVHLGPRSVDAATLPGSDFHLMVNYRQKTCGECFGSVSMDLKHLIISELTADLSVHGRAEWLTSLASLRFAENYGARLHVEAILVLHPSEVMQRLAACLGFEAMSLSDIGRVIRVEIQTKQARSSKRPAVGSDGTDAAASSTGDSKPRSSGTRQAGLSLYQLKAIRSMIGVDSPLPSA